MQKYLLQQISKIGANVVKYGYKYIFTSTNCLTGTVQRAEASKKITSKISH